jgi:outer membrane protein TolC
MHRLLKILRQIPFSLALGLLLVGCVNQRNEVQTYRDVLDAGVPMPHTYVARQPLGLQRAMALANRDNEQLAEQGENYLQALINKNRAVAAFLPTVSLSPSFIIEQAPKNGTTTATPITKTQLQTTATAGGYVISGDTFHQFQAPIVGSMSLYNASNIPNLQAADEQIVQQRHLLLDAQAVVLLNVAQTYYQVLRSEQQVLVLQDSVQVDQARLNDVQQRYNNHLALALEVSQTESQLAATRAELTQAQNDVRNGRRLLAYLIGVPAVDGPLSNDVSVPDELVGVEEFRKLEMSRPDLLAADAAVRAARYSVDAAIGQYYPSVSLNVSGFLYREYFSSASKWDAILVANVPIFSAGIIEADVRTAWSKLRQAALFQDDLRRQIDRDVQNAFDNLTSSREILADLKAEVQAAADARRQSGQLLDNGLALPLDVLIAQDTLLNAELAYTGELFDRDVFYLDLLRAVGSLTPISFEGAHPTTLPTTLPTTYPTTLPQ